MKKVVIDAGHGGTDPGTVANGITEKDYTLKISKYIQKRLDDLGIENSMTRTTDETLGPSVRPERVQSFYGKDKDVIVLSNHINAGGGDGAEVIYSLRNNDTLAKGITNEIAKTGQNVRKYFQRRLPSNPSKDYYYLLRDTPNNETLIVEYGFADSSGDDVNMIKNNWEELAEAVVRALALYIGVPYDGPVGSNYYTVKSGDTLWKIANAHQTSVDAIKKANNLTSNSLTVGQLLLLPTEGTSINTNGTYTVKSGDSLWKIANQYNMTVASLKQLNNLTSDALQIGQILKVNNSGSSSNPVNPSNTYTVVSGDSLYKIANRFGVTVSDIMLANNLSNSNLSIGQKLVIPSNSSNNVYTVVNGDSLYKIAQRFNTSVQAIQRLNNLNSTSLSIGQKLLIPNS
jgi:LysM repeat protein